MPKLLLAGKYYVLKESRDSSGIISKIFFESRPVCYLLRKNTEAPHQDFSHAQTCHFAVKLQTRKPMCVCLYKQVSESVGLNRLGRRF